MVGGSKTRFVVVAAVLLVAAYWLALGLYVYGTDDGGPCPFPTSEQEGLVTRQGWSWPDLGYVCLKERPNDRVEKTVIRWFGD